MSAINYPQNKGAAGCWWLTPIIRATHEDCGSKLALANSSARPYLGKQNKTKQNKKPFTKIGLME
jgi:hypothetical protein